MSEWKLSHTFASPQGEIRWDVFGDGPPVVLLHGTPNWSFIWRKVVRSLAARRRVYVFDWPGFGSSAKHEGQNVSWDEQPRRLAELLGHWELEAPAVVAFDFAPIFALRAHLLEGVAIGPLVLADAAVIPPFVTRFSRLAREHIGVFRALPAHIAGGMIAAHLHTATRHPMAPEVLAGYMRPWQGEAGVAAYWRAVAAYDEDLARPVAERLHHLDTPTLVLWGAHDHWLPLSMGEALAAAIPGARLAQVPDAGHFVPEDNPEGFAAALAAFLDEAGH